MRSTVGIPVCLRPGGCQDDEVLVALKRGEGYDDVHPELVSADAIGERWPEYRTIHGDELRPEGAAE